MSGSLDVFALRTYLCSWTGRSHCRIFRLWSHRIKSTPIISPNPQAPFQSSLPWPLHINGLVVHSPQSSLPPAEFSIQTVSNGHRTPVVHPVRISTTVTPIQCVCHLPLRSLHRRLPSCFPRVSFLRRQVPGPIAASNVALGSTHKS